MKAVPTWNYVSVHLYGKMEFINSQEDMFESLDDLTNKYESSNSPYILRNVAPNVMTGMIKGTVLFKINIIKINAKAKLS